MQKDSMIDLKSFQELCQKAWEQKKKLEEMSAQVTAEGKILEGLKSKVLAHMQANDLQKQHVSGFGTLSIKTRCSVKVPQGDDKLVFFDALKKDGIFETMATIHSATLNSWYEERMQEALDRGEIEFKYPGIQTPKDVMTIEFRKG